MAVWPAWGISYQVWLYMCVCVCCQCVFIQTSLCVCSRFCEMIKRFGVSCFMHVNDICRVSSKVAPAIYNISALLWRPISGAIEQSLYTLAGCVCCWTAHPSTGLSGFKTINWQTASLMKCHLAKSFFRDVAELPIRQQAKYFLNKDTSKVGVGSSSFFKFRAEICYCVLFKGWKNDF